MKDLLKQIKGERFVTVPRLGSRNVALSFPRFSPVTELLLTGLLVYQPTLYLPENDGELRDGEVFHKHCDFII